MKNKQQLRLLGSDLKRAFSYKLWLCVPLIPLLVLLDNVGDARHIGSSEHLSIFYFYFHSVSFGGVFGTSLLSMLCVVPFVWAAQTEIGARYAAYPAQRVSTRSYCLSKFITGIVSGGALNALGFSLFFLVMRFLLPPISADDAQSLSTLAFVRFLSLDSVLPYALFACLFGFLRGALWCGVAMMISLKTTSAAAVYLTPFVGLYLLRQGSVTLEIPSSMRPDLWLDMRVLLQKSEIVTVLASLIFVGVVLLICGIIFLRDGRRLLEA